MRPSGVEKREYDMPLFMDIHSMDGPVGVSDAAQAHQADLKVQGEYHVDYKHYAIYQVSEGN
jgi:hypothetical protein